MLDISLETFAATELIENFLGQTAAPGSEGLPNFRELTPSPSSGCAGGLVAPKLMTDATKQSAHSEDGDGVIPLKVGNFHILTRLSARENFINFLELDFTDKPHIHNS